MTPATNRLRWTTADLALFSDDDRRYEMIDGELIITGAQRWSHQKVTGRIFAALDSWCQDADLGRTAINPGIIFTDEDNVIPDVAWASNERVGVSGRWAPYRCNKTRGLSPLPESLERLKVSNPPK